MKKLRESLIIKLVVHLCLFVLGIVILSGSYNIFKFLYTYSYDFNIFSKSRQQEFSYTNTEIFEKKFSKYTERIAAYVQLNESGYTSEYSSYGLDSLINGDFYSTDNNKTNHNQLDFEFYNKKLNTSNTNFIYYVLNMNTKQEYFSPYFSYKSDGSKYSVSQIRSNISTFTETIESRDSYFILNTNNCLYATNRDNWGYISPQNASWISDCIQGVYSIENTIENTLIHQKKTDTYDFFLNTQYIDYSQIELSENKSDYIIYASVLEDFSNTGDDFYPEYKTYMSLYEKYKQGSTYIIPSIILFIMFLIISVQFAGHSKKQDRIKLIWIDKLYSEFTLIIFIATILIYVTANCLTLLSIKYTNLYIFNMLPYPFSKFVIPKYTFIVFLYIMFYPLIIFIFLSIVRKLKSKMLIRHTLVYNIFIAFKKIFSKGKLTLKVFLSIIGFFTINIGCGIIFLYNNNSKLTLYILFLSIVYILSGYFLIKYFYQIKRIANETEKIANGDLSHKISTGNFYHSLKKLGNYINNIGDGLSNAVEEKLKSERLKTELITNVSHDIKTPLTSIINYVDLMKKEELNNTTAKGYLDVLEAKSWRLKTLIEDLVEASKASSGNIQLNLEPLNIVELVRQSAGEFQDRFNDKELELVLVIEKEPVYIMADGRITFRIIENIFSNAAKYSLSGTRVYVDISCSDLNVVICIKNISANKLNINSNELMERFVRGDLARNTEGNGLGLSIAKSLASLQNSSFKIELDGDLFKAIISFTMIEQENTP